MGNRAYGPFCVVMGKEYQCDFNFKWWLILLLFCKCLLESCIFGSWLNILFCCTLTAIWNQHKFIADRLAQRWKEYEERQPKLQANWDRDAKRPPQVKSAPAKLKPKPKPKKAKVEGKDAKAEEAFPVVEFLTPPATPPPPPPEKLPVVPDQDDDFWEFYDQYVPK